MMLGVIGSDGSKMPPIWFEKGYRLTAAHYRDLLEKKVLPWIRKTVKTAKYVFQQDGAPAHTANVVQNWMKQHMSFWPKDYWPPQSPDLNPLDYSVWWHIESRACATRHASVAALKRAVNKEWRLMDQAYVKNTCKAFRHRLERIIAAAAIRKIGQTVL